MKILSQIETPTGGSYVNFEENLSKIIDGVMRVNKKFGSAEDGKQASSCTVVIEQNFGINALLSCKYLKDKYSGTGMLDVVYAFNMRDKNRIAVLSDLITLKQLGIKDIIMSEGVHPLKTVFSAAKPVYDIDVVSFSSIIKKEYPDFGFFNLGVMVGASTPMDFSKIKKLGKIGIDIFVINYSGDDIDINIVNYIKSKGKSVLLYTKESDVKPSLEEYMEKSLKLNADGIIIKILDEKSNIFTRY